MTDGPDGVRLESGAVDLLRNRLTGPDGATTTLTTKEGALLRYLVGRGGEDVSRDDLLVEVWGYRRGAATRAIDAAVQRLRAKIERDPANPRHLLTVTGVGYRFVGLPSGPEVRLVAAVPASPAVRLPDDDLHGRDADAARLGRLLGSARLVTVLGPAGIGKTRLAVSVADAAQGAVVAVELETATSAQGVRDAVAAALGSPLASGGDDDDPDDLLAAALGARGPALLLLDNLEQVIAEATPLIAAWLARTSELTILTTSREPLRIAGEVVLDLAPLEVNAAVDLFVARARAAHPGFDPEAADRDTLRSLVTRLDGLPLAIELAAARAGLLSPAKMLGRLTDRFALLVSRRRDVPARQRTLRGALDWSWDLLDEAERSALAQCSVFRGVFDFDAADAVVESRDDSRGVLDLIEDLRDRSLIQATAGDPDETASPRLRMLTSVRAYAAERLAESPAEQDAVRERHDRYFVDSARGLADALHGRGAVEATLKLRRYADDLDAVAHRERADPADRAAASLALYRAFRGNIPAARSVEVIAAVDPVGLPPVLEVEVRTAQALALVAHARPQEAEAGAATAARVAAAHGVPADLRLGAEIVRALAQRARGGLVEAEALLRSVIVEADAAHAIRAGAEARVTLGSVLLYGRNDAEVEALCRRALQDAQRSRLAMIELNAARSLARCLAATDRWEEAMKALEAALAMSERVGDLRMTSLLLTDLSAVLAEAPLEVRDRYLGLEERSLAIARDLGDPRPLAIALRNLALERIDHLQFDDGSAMLEEAERLAGAGGDRLMASRARCDRGTAMLLQRRFEEAGELLESALQASAEAGDATYVAIARANLAVLAHARGDRAEATRRYDEVADHVDALGSRIYAYIRAYRWLLDRSLGVSGADTLETLRDALTDPNGRELLRVLEGDEGAPGPAGPSADVQLAKLLLEGR